MLHRAFFSLRSHILNLFLPFPAKDSTCSMLNSFQSYDTSVLEKLPVNTVLTILKCKPNKITLADI